MIMNHQKKVALVLIIPFSAMEPPESGSSTAVKGKRYTMACGIFPLRRGNDTLEHKTRTAKSGNFRAYRLPI